ncbi:MAG: hypothetical protein N4A35_11930 [Flavobacteriales bacterium]|jgi:aromatic ring-cleaving dioxygenase|nr:hypothetical protein [Flavobacteriales bacterium]
MEVKAIVKNVLIYLFLIIGWLYLYHLDIDVLLHPNKKVEAASKVDFVYQQF